MNYPLQQLDHFIHKTHKAEFLINAINEGTYTSCIWKDVLKEDENIKILLLQDVALAQKKKQISLCINTAHIGCLNLSATLSTYIHSVQSLSTVNDHHRQIIHNYLQLQNKIQSLILFIEENFEIYCNQFNYSFGHFPAISLNELSIKFAALKQKLQQQCRDSELLRLATIPAEEFFSLPVLNTRNYARFIYFKEYIFHLEKLLLQNKTLDITQRLKQCLLLLNYNKLSFANYLLANLKTQVSEVGSTSEKLEHWYLSLKEYKQLHHLPYYAMYPGSPSLKKMMIRNIEEEITFLKRQYKHQAEVFPCSTSVETHGEKLLTSLSVAQLALFIRLLLDAGILQTKNQSALFKKIAGAIQTQKTAQISEESLRSKFYTPQNASATIIKEYLLKMMNLLRGY